MTPPPQRPSTLVPEIRDRLPPPLEQEGGGLRLALPGKNALFIALNPHGVLSRGEVGKIPHVLPDEKGQSVEHLMIRV